MLAGREEKVRSGGLVGLRVDVYNGNTEIEAGSVKWTGVVLLSINAKEIGKEREVTRRSKMTIAEPHFALCLSTF